MPDSGDTFWAGGGDEHGVIAGDGAQDVGLPGVIDALREHGGKRGCGLQHHQTARRSDADAVHRRGDLLLGELVDAADLAGAHALELAGDGRLVQAHGRTYEKKL